MIGNKMVGVENACLLYLGENICSKHHKWLITCCILRRFPTGDHTQNHKFNYMLLYGLIQFWNPYITLSKAIGWSENCMTVKLFLLPDKLFPWKQPFILLWYVTFKHCLNWKRFLVLGLHVSSISEGGVATYDYENLTCVLNLLHWADSVTQVTE